MRITVTGAAGMLGRDSAARLSTPAGTHELHLTDTLGCDITDPGAVRESFAAEGQHASRNDKSQQ